MPKTYEEIDSVASQMKAAGASDSDIQQYVSLAMQEVKAPAQAAPAPAAMATPPAPEQVPAGPATLGEFMKLRAEVNDSNLNRQMGKFGSMGADMATEGGLAAAGVRVGAMAGPYAPIAVPVMGAIGGGIGYVLNSMRKGEPVTTGQAAGASIANAVPGVSLAGQGVKAIAGNAARYATANTMAKAAETKIDQGRLPTPVEAGVAAGAGVVGAGMVKALDSGAIPRAVAERAKLGSVRNKVVTDATDRGFVVEPAGERPSAMNNTLQSLAGKAATHQEASVINSEIRNKLVREDLGLPPGAPLTPQTLEGIRTKAAEPYKVLESISEQAKANLATLKKNKLTISDPHELAVASADPDMVREVSDLAVKAGADVQALKKARIEQRQAWDRYKDSRGDPKFYDAAKAAEDAVDAIENNILEASKKLGIPGLPEQLTQSRRLIAKTHEVQYSLNDDGYVSGKDLAKRFNQGAKLDGNLELIAKFTNSVPRVNTDRSMIPPPSVDKLKGYAAMTMALGGGSAMGPRGLALGALPYTDTAIRKVLLSGPYQRAFATPYYGPNIPDYIAGLARSGAEQQGRDATEKPVPYKR
jgi:hypothetical protein